MSGYITTSKIQGVPMARKINRLVGGKQMPGLGSYTPRRRQEAQDVEKN